jgi:hypothetical protein
MMSGKKKFSAIHAVLLLSFGLSVVGIWWGLPSYRGWAPDEILPSRVLEGMAQYFSGDWVEKYPPLHYYLLSLLYLPIVFLHKIKLVDVSHLPTYTVLFYLGRFLSLVMATGATYLVYRCGLEIYDRRSSLLAALITALIVPFVYHAKIVNVDLPYTFWFLWSVYFFVRILKTQASKYYLLFGLTAAFSICTKDQAYGLYILPPFLILASQWLEKRRAGEPRAFVRSLFSHKNLFALAAAIGTFLIIHNILFNAEGLLNHFRLIGGRMSRDYRMFENTLAGHVQLLWETLRQIRYSLGWPLFIVCGLGLAYSLVPKKKNYLLLSLTGFAISYYVFYINVILYNYDRFNLPLCIVLAFFGGKALSDAIGSKQKFRRVKMAVLGVLFAYTFLYAFSVDILMVKDSRYHIEKWMKTNIPKEAMVGVAGLIEYVPRMESFRWTALKPSLEAFEKIKRPDYLLFNVDYSRSFAEKTPGHLFFLQFYRHNPDYQLAFEYKTPLPWLLLKSRDIMTNINTINPEIRIFQKVSQ